MNVKQLDCLLAEHEQKRGRLWLRIRAVVRRFLDLNWEGEGMTKEELEEQNANLIAMLKSEREVRVNDDYLKGICERDAYIGNLEGEVQDWTSEYYELENLMNNKLAEAKEIIKDLLGLKSSISSAKEAERRFVIREKAEKFLEEKKGD